MEIALRFIRQLNFFCGIFCVMIMVQKRRRKRTRRQRRKTSYIKREYRRVLCRFRKLIILFCICAVVCIGLLIYNGGFSKFIKQNRDTVISNKYNGIDVSKYQGHINWNKVAEDKNIQFVYIKASEGASEVDKRYCDNISGARDAGLKVGSYHYFIGRKTAKEQFENFNRYVQKNEQDLIPMVDVEEAGNRFVSRTQLQNNLNEFMQLIKEEYGKSPLLYSQYKFYKDKLSPEFDRYFLFIARYGNKPPILDTSGKHNIWQYSEKGTIQGIKGHVDLNRFCNGTTLSDIEL